MDIQLTLGNIGVEKNNVDFMLITEHDNRLGKPVWNKELIYEKGVKTTKK